MAKITTNVLLKLPHMMKLFETNYRFDTTLRKFFRSYINFAIVEKREGNCFVSPKKVVKYSIIIHLRRHLLQTKQQKQMSSWKMLNESGVLMGKLLQLAEERRKMDPLEEADGN